MGILFSLNWLDLVIIVLLIATIGIGYVQRLLRQVIGMGVLYLAAVLAAQYFGMLTNFIVNALRTDAPSRFVNALSFLAILFFVMSLLNVLIYDTYRSTQLRIFPLIDHAGGSVVALASMFVALALILPVIGFSTVERWPYFDAAREALKEAMQRSFFVDYLNTIKPTLIDALRPWLPTGVPGIFGL